MAQDEDVRTGFSVHADATAAVDEIYEQVYSRNAKLTAFFCSMRYDLDKIASRFRERFGDMNVVGCTSAGEMGPGGYVEGSISAFSIGGSSFEVATGRLDNIQDFEAEAGHSFVRKLIAQLHDKGKQLSELNTFGFQLIERTPLREDIVTSTFYSAMDDLPLIGVTAADNLRFEQSWVFHDGKFHAGAAVLNLIWTTRNLLLFQAHNFVECAGRLVITASDPSKRIVTEINGGPAAEEYANAVGVRVEDLSAKVFAQHPVLVSVSGQLHARTILKLYNDGSLQFGTAIDQGLVLKVGRAVNMQESLKNTIAEIVTHFGRPALTIGCDSAYRRLEVLRESRQDCIHPIICDNHVVGAIGYGQQINGLADAQSFVAMAIGNK